MTKFSACGSEIQPNKDGTPTMIEPEKLAAMLLDAIGCDGKPLLTAEQARRRAEAMVSEMDALGWRLQIFAWKNFVPSFGWCPYPAYLIDDPRYDLNKVAPGDKGQFAVNAPGLSCGDLLKLGRACELKQQLIGSQWPKGLRNGLRDQQSHLDALEEVLWLGRFKEVKNARRGMVQANGMDADWEFSSSVQAIQMEVKNRRKEWSGIIDQAHRGREHPSWHDDFQGKFTQGEPGRLKVACVTTYFEPDEALYRRAHELLTQGESIDAVLVWSGHAPTGRQLTWFSAKQNVRDILGERLIPVPHEDAAKVLLMEHAGRNSDEQRVLTMEETISHFMNFARSEDTNLE